MGLFSKHKDDKKDEVPKAPPVTSTNSSEGASNASNVSGNGNDQNGTGTPPPVPGQASGDISPSPNLSAPPAPPGIDSNSLNDIKAQVSGDSNLKGNSTIEQKNEVPSVMSVSEKTASEGSKDDGAQESEASSNDEVSSNQASGEEKNDDSISFDSSDDDLFDFSNIENSDEKKTNDKGNLDSEDEINSDIDLSSRKDAHHDSFNFINRREKLSSNSISDSFFVTTSQYKNLMEIIDRVKERVKESSDSHLRLLDIKAEEDVEYENLRKDFQFIEDKLYEVDGLIFDK